MGFSEQLKANIRRKSHFLCCLCKALGVEVHHIIPQEEDGPDTADNAAPLCPSCHETYGANPQKRKFIREARNLWYEICQKRFSSDADRLDEIKKLLKNTVSYEDFKMFRDELLSRIPSLSADRVRSELRGENKILFVVDELFDKVWYNRHLCLREDVTVGKTKVDPKIWKGALKAARNIEKKYRKKELGPWDDFEWGMINGKLSALRWVLGEEWDMLDT